jgi:phosphopantothenoylcysteine decarboxylase/phosphopantothenate--cysteine ligase
MGKAVATELPETDVLIMAAAPADFRPARVAPQKIKKGRDSTAPVIELAQTDDILQSTIASRKQGAVIVGFALETEDVLRHGREKLEKKKLDMIVANSAVEKGAGFGVDTNRVTIISGNGEAEEIPLMQKTELADIILDRVEKLLNGRKG